MKERIRTLKTRGITKCIESDYNLENYNNYETYIQTTCGGLGCPKKTKEIQDPTKRKYKNQKKNTKLSDIIDICGDSDVSCCYSGHEL